ncbi:glycerol kinase GlpK [Pedobacter sp. SYP-B3415]|uniref:glycerol kinase GlpK n=1 Tax=Pedobacter sp. SYP-B3415 TaxID=2496641 RepID=UPI00101CC2BD|nr:glycerol kinase GlpK [Pedobacter sp. SYP-B3415]
MEQYILSLDQGTTSSRAIVFDKNGDIVSIAQKEFKQYYPKAGWVEHDPQEIWSSQIAVAAEAISKAGLMARQINAIGITNQRETTVVWDRETGEPVYNAIVWQDRRMATYCDSVKKETWNDSIQKKTGLIIDSYFSAVKIKWILDEVPGAREKAEAGKLAFGTVDSWLIWKLTAGAEHITDVTNASRTLLYNINTLQWDTDMAKHFGIPLSMLPAVKSSSEVYCKTSGQIFAHQIPIAGIAGDQQSALFGQMCTQPGMVKNTYGTGCFMLMNIGNDPKLSTHNLLTTIAWKIGDKVSYALEGSIFIAGAVVQWLRDELKLISTSADVEHLANTVPDTQGVYVVPAFAGLGAPYWDQHARGTITGITRGTNAAHFARAALESIAYQTRDVLKAMEADAGTAIKELRVDGGATANNLLMQFQADLLQCQVIRPEVTEVTAIGAAYLAGLATGFWGSIEEIGSQWKIDRNFDPGDDAANAERIKGWNRAVRAARANAED